MSNSTTNTSQKINPAVLPDTPSSVAKDGISHPSAPIDGDLLPFIPPKPCDTQHHSRNTDNSSSNVNGFQRNGFRVNLAEAIQMIASTLDFVGVEDLSHGRRVGYTAFRCAEVLGWQRDMQRFALFAGMLHDCGVSSTREHQEIVDADVGVPLQDHCVRGFEYLNGCRILREFAEPGRFHHTPWKELIKVDLPAASIEVANLIHLADMFDVLRLRNLDLAHPETITLQRQSIMDCLRHDAPGAYSPDFLDALETVISTDAFWFSLTPEYIVPMTHKIFDGAELQLDLSPSELSNLATFVSRIVDAKSPFTHQHSERVALLSETMAAEFNLSKTTQIEIRVAGLLHDIGKLRTPDALLDKPGGLTDEEFSVIRRHTFDTKQVLDSFIPDSRIGWWAACHHEKLDGSGYPFGLTATELDLEARIIAVCDIFQALAQNRPYRPSMEKDEILGIIEKIVARGQLDHDVFEALKARGDEYFGIATG